MTKVQNKRGSKEKKWDQNVNSSKNSQISKSKPKKFIFSSKIPKTDLTIILDLDNTLISALFFPIHPEQCDFLFTLQQGKQKSKIGVIKRPNVIQFLNALSSFSTLYLFTTSEREYANQILSQIDPSGIFFTKIFTREHCTQDNCKKYKKDFAICGTDMKRTIIVDDLPENFINFPNNGILIKPFNGEQDDDDLSRVFDEIIRLSYLEDVRDGINV